MSDTNLGNRVHEIAAAGNFTQVAGHESAMDTFAGGSSPIFNRAVVLEVIFDPTMLDDDRKADMLNTLGVENGGYIDRLPRNTIIAALLRDGKNPSNRPQFFFPFFPPNLSFPVKPGEHVWVMFEHTVPQEKSVDHGFWISRITEPRDIDDVNYTHADRKYDQSQQPGAKELASAGGTPPTPGFPNGAVVRTDSGYEIDGQTASINGDEKAYERLLNDSDAGKLNEYEPVPKFTKRPSDHAIEGSNNTLIVFGTDRTGAAADTQGSATGKRVKGKPKGDQAGKAGMIDIVVGRGQKRNKQAEIKNSLGNTETDKSISKETSNEGDPDLDTDLSRFYVSMKTDVDGNFSVSLKGDSKAGVGPGSVIKSDHVRIIARKTIKFLVQPKFDSADADCAGIVIDAATGNIVFVPSAAGIVMLGGFDADKAILTQPAGAVNGGGQVAAPPIISTIGAQVGIGGVNGTYATRVMVK